MDNLANFQEYMNNLFKETSYNLCNKFLDNTKSDLREQHDKLNEDVESESKSVQSAYKM